MKTKILGVILTLGAIAGSFMSCSEPPAECQVGLAGANSFATVYVLNGPVPAGCESLVQAGDIVGMEYYHPATADKKTFDTSKSTLAIQTDFIGNAQSERGVDPNAAHTMYAMGAFSATKPDSNGVCAVPTFTSSAEQDFPDVPAMGAGGAGGAGGSGAGGAGGGGGAAPATPELPADDVKYTWSNFQVTVSPEIQGTQFTADLKFSQVLTPETGTPLSCEINYRAIGIWPAVNCVKVDESGMMILDANGNQQPDESLCSPCQDIDAGRTIASGIAPETPTACKAIFAPTDPYAGDNVGERSLQYYCVLDGASLTTKLPVTRTAPSCGAVAQ